ncbi:MAG: hypothetical protein WCA81_07380 [Rhizomicrobium sp.]
MRYLYVKWTHKDPGAPAHIYSELGDDRFELRKVEIWADGRKGFADSTEEAGGTALGSMPVPSLAEIAAQAEYQAKEIPQEEFQRIWLKRR